MRRLLSLLRVHSIGISSRRASTQHDPLTRPQRQRWQQHGSNRTVWRVLAALSCASRCPLVRPWPLQSRLSAVRGDLIRIVGKLIKKRDKLDAIIIETTGLANPGPVIQTFFVDDDIKVRTRTRGLRLGFMLGLGSRASSSLHGIFMTRCREGIMVTRWRRDATAVRAASVRRCLRVAVAGLSSWGQTHRDGTGHARARAQEACALDAVITVVDARHVLQHLDEVKPEGVVNEAGASPRAGAAVHRALATVGPAVCMRVPAAKCMRRSFFADCLRSALHSGARGCPHRALPPLSCRLHPH